MEPDGKFKKVMTLVGAVGIILAFLVSIGALVERINAVTVCRAEMFSLKAQNEELKVRTERLFDLSSNLVKEGSISLDVLKPFLSPVQAAEISKEASDVIREQLPFSLESRFFPSGWMGDGESGQKYISLKRRPASIDGNETIAIELKYSRGPKEWAGIYWQYPDNNWGNKPGRNLIGAKAITFSAKGMQGGEIVEFKSGGISGRYNDSYQVSLGKLVLHSTWTRYKIDISKSDLSSVIGAFAWVVAAADNEQDSITIYLANLQVE